MELLRAKAKVDSTSRQQSRGESQFTMLTVYEEKDDEKRPIGTLTITVEDASKFLKLRQGEQVEFIIEKQTEQ